VEGILAIPIGLELDVPKSGNEGLVSFLELKLDKSTRLAHGSEDFPSATGLEDVADLEVGATEVFFAEAETKSPKSASSGLDDAEGAAEN